MNNLRITTTDAKIGIDISDGHYQMSSPKGEQRITTTDPKMTLSGEPVKVIIDSYQSWAERGFKNNLDLFKHTAQLGKQAAINGVSKRVADGNRMADIKNGMPPAIPELAERNSKPRMREFGYGVIPKSRPTITVVGGQSISWQRGSTNIDYTPRKPQINYTKGNVKTYLKQKESINIEYIDTRG